MLFSTVQRLCKRSSSKSYRLTNILQTSNFGYLSISRYISGLFLAPTEPLVQHVSLSANLGMEQQDTVQKVESLQSSTTAFGYSNMDMVSPICVKPSSNENRSTLPREWMIFGRLYSLQHPPHTLVMYLHQRPFYSNDMFFWYLWIQNNAVKMQRSKMPLDFRIYEVHYLLRCSGDDLTQWEANNLLSLVMGCECCFLHIIFVDLHLTVPFTAVSSCKNLIVAKWVNSQFLCP